MSTEFENSSIDVEQLLRTKSWEQLSDAEQAEFLKLGSGREEYTRMFSMTNQLMSASGVHDEDLKPSPNTRGNLLSAFANEQRKRRAAWWSSLWYGLCDKLRFDIPMVRIAVAAVLLLAGVFGVMKVMEKGEEPQIVNEPNPKPANENAVPVPSNSNNNIVEQPSDNNPVVNPDQTFPPDTQIGLNAPQVVMIDPNQNAIVPDTNPQYITAFTNNGQPLIVDTGTLVLPTATFNTNNVTCFGASNGSVTVTANGGANYSYQWTPITNATVIGLPARSRPLENDAAVLDVFFAVK
jgi:hypothetical protein